MENSHHPPTVTRGPIDAAIVALLERIPQKWAEWDPDDLTDAEDNALFRLVASGLVERRSKLRMHMTGQPVTVEATFTATGVRGGVDALQPIASALWSEWADAWRKWEADEDTRGLPAFRAERGKPDEWRLTSEGFEARAFLADRNEQRALIDYILRRDDFQNRPDVPGRGKLLTMNKSRDGDRADGADTTVNVGNWKEGGDALAQAFAPLMEQMFKQMAKQANSGTGVDQSPGDWMTVNEAAEKMVEAMEETIAIKTATNRINKARTKRKNGTTAIKSRKRDGTVEVHPGDVASYILSQKRGADNAKAADDWAAGG